MESVSHDILLEVKQLLALCLPHLPTLLHVHSLLRLNSQRTALYLRCAPGTHLCKSVLTNLSILHLHKSAAWAFWIVLRVECEYVCYTSGSSFPQMLCRCLILHSPNQGIMPLLMLVPPPGMTFTNVSTYWNPSKSLSVFHMPNFSEILYLFLICTSLNPNGCYIIFSKLL